MKEKKYNFKVNVVHTPASEESQRLIADKQVLLGKYKQQEGNYKFLSKYISSLQEEINETSDEKYVLTISLGNKRVEVDMKEAPTEEDIKELQEEMKEKLAEKRKERKQIEPEHRETLGFEYEVVGGVFTEPGRILEIGKTQNKLRRIRQRKIPHKLIPDNHIGIEIEFYCKIDRDHLEKKLIEAGLTSAVNVKNDISIKPTEERRYGHEITVLTKEQYVQETITKLCAVLNSPEVSAEVNSSCGLHVHLDARHRDYKKMFYNLTGALPFLTKLVPSTRVNNRFCMNNTVRSYDEFLTQDVPHERRRQAINGTAYEKYRTIEVRMHSGSTNATKIINWCKVLMSIANSSIALGDEVATLDDYSKFYRISDSMYTYLKNRIEQLGKKITTTEEDFADTTAYEVVA